MNLFSILLKKSPTIASRYLFVFERFIRRSALRLAFKFRDKSAVAAAAASHNQSFFKTLGVEKTDAVQKCAENADRLGLSFSLKTQSVHHLAFTALSLSGFEPKRVLELGTFRGEATLLLADLFPNAEIHTVDLPEDDPILAQHRPNPEDSALRDQRLKRENIHVHRINTCMLWTLNVESFDLIWCDAGHEYPEVAWDHFYCLSKMAPGGWLFSDDIRKPINPMFAGTSSPYDAYRTLEYICNRAGLKPMYLLKREDAFAYFADPKFVAGIHRSNA